MLSGLGSPCYLCTPRWWRRESALPEDVGMLSMQDLQMNHLRHPQTQGGILLAQLRQLLLRTPCTLLCSTQSSLLLLHFGMERLHLTSQSGSLQNTGEAIA